jgi:hypothetical protein
MQFHVAWVDEQICTKHRHRSDKSARAPPSYALIQSRDVRRQCVSQQLPQYMTYHISCIPFIVT